MAARPKGRGWRIPKSKGRSQTSSRRCSGAPWRETIDGEESGQAEEIDRLLLSSLKYWKDLEQATEGASPGESPTEGQPPVFAEQQPEYVGQTRAKMPSPTPKPKPGGGKAPTKEKEKPTPTPTSTPTPTPTPTSTPYPTTADVKTFEEKQNEQIKKAKEELDKAGTDAEKQRRAKAKLNALEKICFEAKWAGTHASDDKKNAANSYDDASEILKRIDEVPDARDRLKKAGLSDKTINEMLDALNDAASESVNGLPSDRQIAQQAGNALRVSGYDANADGGKKGEQEGRNKPAKGRKVRTGRKKRAAWHHRQWQRGDELGRLLSLLNLCRAW